MLLDPRTWALAHRIDELLPRLPADVQHEGVGRDPRLGIRGADRGGADGRRGRRRDPRPPQGARAHPCDTRPARRRLGHPPVRDLAGDRRLRRRALPVRLRLDARARPPRADLRPPCPRRRPRPRDRDPRQRPDARPPPAAPRPLRQLALLAGPRLRPRLGPHPALSGLSPGRRAPRLRRLRDLRRDRRPADPHRRRPRVDLPLVGRPPPARPRHRSRSGSWTPRPAATTPPPSSPSSPRWSSWRPRRASPPTARSPPRRSSPRTASSPPATASTPSSSTPTSRPASRSPDLVSTTSSRPAARTPQDLGCADELGSLTDLVARPARKRQIETARDAPSLGRLVERLSDRFAE